MIQIVASTPGRRLPFYLAMEEWVARTMPKAEYFFTWIVRPTVIFGRNQDALVEVDLDYCRERGIEVYRRRSGGGCVYADADNLMISYIAPSTDVAATFGRFTALETEMLRSLGVEATASGRNDVMIGERKVAGNAFYRLPDCSIVHGTLLLSTDVENMARAITPARSKLESHKVASVHSRITTLREHIPTLTMEELQAHVQRSLADDEYRLNETDIKEIEQIEAKYYDMKWRFGARGILGSPKNQRRILRRIDGVGQLDITLTYSDGVIADIDLMGDFFLLSDLDHGLLDHIKGAKSTAEALHEALRGVDASQVIAGLSTEALIHLLASAPPPTKTQSPIH